MEMIADILLAAGAFGAAIYCYVLSARLKRLQTLENGMGGAIAVLSVQVDDMTRALENARGAANNQASTLQELTQRGETVAARLDLILATMHDVPEPPSTANTPREAESDITERRLRFVRRKGLRDTLEAAE
jgi:hypothetical protein